jgi:hypothetical protein
MHLIFQRHHIPPDDFLSKPKWAQAFMLESMRTQLKIEHEQRETLKQQREAARARRGG